MGCKNVAVMGCSGLYHYQGCIKDMRKRPPKKLFLRPQYIIFKILLVYLPLLCQKSTLQVDNILDQKLGIKAKKNLLCFCIA